MYLVAWEGSVHQMHHCPVSAAVADAMLVVVAKYKSVIKKKKKKFLIKQSTYFHFLFLEVIFQFFTCYQHNTCKFNVQLHKGTYMYLTSQAIIHSVLFAV